MEVTFTPSVVLAYSARRRSGLSLQGLIFTKLAIDFYLSMAYVSRFRERSGIMVIHRDASGPNCRSACDGGAGENDRRKGRKGRKLNLRCTPWLGLANR